MFWTVLKLSFLELGQILSGVLLLVSVYVYVGKRCSKRNFSFLENWNNCLTTLPSQLHLFPVKWLHLQLGHMPRLMMCFIDAESYVNKTRNYSATTHKHRLSYDNIVYLKTKYYNISDFFFFFFANHLPRFLTKSNQSVFLLTCQLWITKYLLMKLSCCLPNILS